MAIFNWFHILSERHCSGCLMPKPKVRRYGWRKAFCPQCEGKLPEPLRWHLFTARSSCWFMRWWRFAKRILREQAGREQ